MASLPVKKVTRQRQQRKNLADVTQTASRVVVDGSATAAPYGETWLPRSERKLPSTDLNVVERQRMAYRLALQSLPYDEIAERCGYSTAAGAWNAAHTYASAVRGAGDAEVAAERDMAAAQLQELYALVLPVAIGQIEAASANEKYDDRDIDPDVAALKPKHRRGPNLWAVDRLVVIRAELNKLLGLYKVDATALQAQVLIHEVTADLSKL